MPSSEDTATAPPALSSNVFRYLETFVYSALSLLLGVAALLALGNAGWQLWAAMRDWSTGSAVFAVIERLLLVFMLIEIMHTIRTSIQSRTLTCEPFLIVALIATVRRVLLITLQSAEVMRDSVWTPDHENIFRATMIELVVLGVLILVMVTSIYLLRRNPGNGRGA